MTMQALTQPTQNSLPLTVQHTIHWQIKMTTSLLLLSFICSYTYLQAVAMYKKHLSCQLVTSVEDELLDTWPHINAQATVLRTDMDLSLTSNAN